MLSRYTRSAIALAATPAAVALLAASAHATPTVRSYGPFDVYFYNAGDVSGSGTAAAVTGAQNWTEEQMSDVRESIRTWDANITNTPGRRIKMAVVWYNFSGNTLGGSESPTNGDGSTSWNYAEHVWREQANYSSGWTQWDTRLIYDTDGAGYAWNFGADSPTGTQIDFRSVVTHEIGHSLGFDTSYYSNDTWGNTWGTAASPYDWAGYKGVTRWDSFLRDATGNRPTSGGTGSPGNFNQTNNPVYFVGPSAVAYNGGNVQVYAPTTYAGNSSLIHLNTTYSNALMSPTVALGQVHRTPTLLEWEMMRDMGWNLLNQWKGPAGGAYNNADSWSGGQVPSGIGATANFLENVESAAAVSFSGGATMGAINFNSTQTYTLNGGTITLDVSTGSASINVAKGNHTISSALVLNDNLQLSVTSASDTLSLNGAVTASGRTITKSGNGTAQLQNIRAAGVNVAAGKVRIAARSSANQAAGTSVVNALSIASGAVFDLTNNSMVIEYSGSAGTLVDAVRQHLRNGRLVSSAAGTPGGTTLGYGDNALLGEMNFGGVDVDSSCLLIKFTFAGDANLDGQVTISDLGELASHWQSTGAVWTGGDFNYDGAVTISDLGELASNWQAGVGNPLGMSFDQTLAAVGFGNVNVPEPAILGFLGFAWSLKRPRRYSPTTPV